MDKQTAIQEHANGVTWQGNFYPFKVAGLTATNQQLNPTRNGRLYVRHINIYVRTVAGDLATYAGVSGFTNHSGYDLAYVALVPGTAQAINHYLPVHMLMDRGTGLQWAVSAAVTDSWFLVIYAELEDK